MTDILMKTICETNRYFEETKHDEQLLLHLGKWRDMGSFKLADSLHDLFSKPSVASHRQESRLTVEDIWEVSDARSSHDLPFWLVVTFLLDYRISTVSLILFIKVDGGTRTKIPHLRSRWSSLCANAHSWRNPKTNKQKLLSLRSATLDAQHVDNGCVGPWADESTPRTGNQPREGYRTTSEQVQRSTITMVSSRCHTERSERT